MTTIQPQTYFVKYPMGKLPLVVDADGSRWLALNLFAEHMELSMRRDVIPQLEHSPRNWKAKVVGGKHCLPMEKVNEFIQKLRCYPAQAAAHDWLGRHATQVLRAFTIPEPVEPMLGEDPETEGGFSVHPICPAIPNPQPVETGLRTFSFGAAPIRVVLKDGEPWWFASEVCEILDLDRSASRRLDDDEKGVHSTRTPGGTQDLTIISESGLYSLVLGSRKPEAKAFKRWVTHEVIPSIRKTGAYGITQRDPMEILNDPIALRGLLSGYTEKVLALECTISVLEPKAAGLDRIATRKDDGARTLTDAAKILQQPPRKFISYLQVEGWIYRQNGRWMAYQPKITAGLMEHKYCTVEHDSGPEFDVAQALITSKGIAKLAAMLGVPVAA